MRKKGFNAEWFVVGEGEQRPELEKKIQALGLQSSFHLIGARANPYPYMKNCDIYVQPSRWEGYGITVAEAKVLCKPIVASDIPEFREQIVSGVNGIISKNEQDTATQIQLLAQDMELQNRLCQALKCEITSCKEITALQELFSTGDTQ